MNRKKIIIISFILIASALLLSLYYWQMTLLPITFAPILTESMKINLVGWNLALARAEFNISVIYTNMDSSIAIQYVEVNGTKVDTYPEHFSLKPGESDLIKVYYPYASNSTYKIVFLTAQDMSFSTSYRTP